MLAETRATAVQSFISCKHNIRAQEKKSSFASKLKLNFAEKAAAVFQSPLDLCKTREFGCFFLQVGKVSVLLLTVSTQRYTSG